MVRDSTARDLIHYTAAVDEKITRRTPRQRIAASKSGSEHCRSVSPMAAHRFTSDSRRGIAAIWAVGSERSEQHPLTGNV